FFLAPTYAQKKDVHLNSSFIPTLINLESRLKETFRYNISLHIVIKQAQVYELEALVPEGWITTFQTGGSEVASIMVDSERTQNISVEILPSPEVKPGKYNIPVTAFSEHDTLALQLEA